MPSVVNDNCVLCRTCVDVCPVGAFHEGDTMMVVDPDTCIDCGMCVSECPNNAIHPADESDAKWVQFNAEKAKEWPEAAK